LREKEVGNMTILKTSSSYFPPQDIEQPPSKVGRWQQLPSPNSCTPLTFFDGATTTTEVPLTVPVTNMEDTLTNMHTDISLIRQKLEEKKPKKVTLAAVNSKLDLILRLLGCKEENI
jgi:hypothetical protein